MRWLFDITHPTGMLFSPKFIKELEKRKHEVLPVTRQFGRASTFMMDLALSQGIRNVRVIGPKHEGRKDKSRTTLYKKLITSAQRTVELAHFVQKKNIQRILGIGSNCPDSARVAFGLGIPYFAFCDMPESYAINMLTLPFSRYVFSPSCIPKKLYEPFAVKNIYFYDSLEPFLWMEEKRPNPKVLSQFDLTEESQFIVFKPTPLSASFNIHEEDVVVDIIKNLTRKLKVKAIGLTHDKLDILRLKGESTILFPKDAVDVQSLLYYASLFVTGGGTMGAECAWWGTPVIFARPKLRVVDEFLVKKGFALASKSHKETLEYAKENIGKRFDAASLRKMKFPLKKIVDIMVK